MFSATISITGKLHYQLEGERETNSDTTTRNDEARRRVETRQRNNCKFLTQNESSANIETEEWEGRSYEIGGSALKVK